ncbi:hypothetical protein TNCV_2967501 [Trichonephila clavipes]|nr:hypothetical protein TNCV_2967501 [Trichonephila clavipes]
MWIFCGPHSTIVGVNRAKEWERRFICPKQSVKPVVLLLHLIEYQTRKLLARVEVRRFQFLVMLQLVGLLSQSYSQCSPVISVRHSCLPRNFSSTELPMCSNRRHRLHRLLHCHGNSSGC